MFKTDRVRRELALKFADQYRTYILPPGMPFNESTMAMVFRSAFLLADTFLKVEELNTEDLVAMGQPRQAPVPTGVPANGAAPVVQFPQAPKAS